MSQGIAIRKGRWGYKLIHAASGLPLFPYPVRLKRQAEEARAEFYATGLDYLLPAAELKRSGSMRQRRKNGAIARKWHLRTLADGPDPKTGEVYSR